MRTIYDLVPSWLRIAENQTRTEAQVRTRLDRTADSRHLRDALVRPRLY